MPLSNQGRCPALCTADPQTTIASRGSPAPKIPAKGSGLQHVCAGTARLPTRGRAAPALRPSPCPEHGAAVPSHTEPCRAVPSRSAPPTAPRPRGRRRPCRAHKAGGGGRGGGGDGGSAVPAERPAPPARGRTARVLGAGAAGGARGESLGGVRREGHGGHPGDTRGTHGGHGARPGAGIAAGLGCPHPRALRDAQEGDFGHCWSRPAGFQLPAASGYGSATAVPRPLSERGCRPCPYSLPQALLLLPSVVPASCSSAVGQPWWARGGGLSC